MKFAWQYRTKDADSWSDDPRWEDSWGRDAIVEHIVAEASRAGVKIRSKTPEPLWVLKVGDRFRPCREFTDGAVPAWIWWAE